MGVMVQSKAAGFYGSWSTYIVARENRATFTFAITLANVGRF